MEEIKELTDKMNYEAAMKLIEEARDNINLAQKIISNIEDDLIIKESEAMRIALVNLQEAFKSVDSKVLEKKKNFYKDVITDFLYLSDSTSEEELDALCNACDYDWDTLYEWNTECKASLEGTIISSNFSRALQESYHDGNALINFAKEYKEFNH